MQDKVNQKPFNENSERHGYWETYWHTTQLIYKGNYVNDVQYGYWVEYYQKEYYYAR